MTSSLRCPFSLKVMRLFFATLANLFHCISRSFFVPTQDTGALGYCYLEQQVDNVWETSDVGVHNMVRHELLVVHGEFAGPSLDSKSLKICHELLPDLLLPNLLPQPEPEEYKIGTPDSPPCRSCTSPALAAASPRSSSACACWVLAY